MTARVVSVQVGQPERRDVPLPSGRPGPPLVTAVWRATVAGPVRVGPLGAEGDGVGDTVNHGGPDKALCAYVADHLPGLGAALDRDLVPGAFGENLSVTGLDESAVAIGDVWAVGTARLQVSQPRGPCATIARRWQVPDLVVRLRASGQTGWYLRVLEEGVVEAGDPVHLLDRPAAAWTVARCNAVAYGARDGGDPALQAALAEAARDGGPLAALSGEWRGMLLAVAAH